MNSYSRTGDDGMKTYAETHSKWIYDWPQIIDDLEHDRYDDEGKFEVYDAASNWPTCACGNQCAALPRDEEGCPVDKVMEKLGGQFFWSIGSLMASSTKLQREVHASRARHYMGLIEDRARKLLA